MQAFSVVYDSVTRWRTVKVYQFILETWPFRVGFYPEIFPCAGNRRRISQGSAQFSYVEPKLPLARAGLRLPARLSRASWILLGRTVKQRRDVFLFVPQGRTEHHHPVLDQQQCHYYFNDQTNSYYCYNCKNKILNC